MKAMNMVKNNYTRRADFMFLVSQRRSSIKRIFFDSQFLNSQVNSSATTKHEVCRLGSYNNNQFFKKIYFKGLNQFLIIQITLLTGFYTN